MEAKKTWDLAAVSSIPLIMTLGNSMLIPILPALERTLHVTSLQISLLITVYSVVAIVLIPIAGYLSDRFGRKKIIIPSLLVAGAGGLLCALAPWLSQNAAYPLILAGRFIQGIGAAGAAPIVMPLVGDMFQKESDVSSGLGMIETSNTFGKVLSPIIGSLLALWTWTAVFYAIPALCLVSVLLVACLVRTPKSESKQDTSFRSFAAMLRTIARNEGRWLAAIFVVGVIAMFVLFGILFYLSETLEERFGIQGLVKGCLLAVPLSALCLASFLAGKAIGENKPRMKWLTVAGLVLLGAALVCMALSSITRLWLLFVWVGLGGIGIGIALPCLDALITEGIKKEQRGTVSAVYSSMRFIGVAAGPPFISVGIKWPSAVLFGLLAGTVLVGGFVALFAIKPAQVEAATAKSR
ncbi:MFS transporter [Paenibacillus tyrfis]|uniref:MFS transporter n=2 Tax=Paenibacillus tyrfis TaxID=1501230 RepID=A0A081P191_9BACL|nr:MFS transporter [Paenibacillus tyrfis]KEQ24464.1 MFS transporter [Paenibacillus tyrfis]